MDDKNYEESAKQLHKWLQTNSQDGDGVYSPGFVSLHPAGGEEEENEFGGVTWIPNKDRWAKPEGSQEPPSFDPLKEKVFRFCKNEEDVRAFQTFLTNWVALHRCSGYCLRKKKVE